MSPSLIKVFRLVKPWTMWLVLAALAALALSLIESAVPLKVRDVVNSALGEGGGLSLRSCITLGCLLAGSQLLKIGQRLATEWPTTRIAADLFQHGVHHLLSYPMREFALNHSGAFQVRLDRSTRAVADLIKTAFIDVLSPLLSLILAAVLIWQANATVGIVAVITIPLLSVLTLWQARSQSGIRVTINRAREEQGVRVAEAVMGIEQVKLFRAESQEAERAGHVSRWLAHKEFYHHVMMAWFDLGKFLIERAGFGAVLILGILAASQPDSQLGVGGVLMLVMLYERIAEPVRHLHRIIDEMSEKCILAKDYLRILNTELVTRLDSHKSCGRGRSVVFDNVTFAYSRNEKVAVRDVTLHIAQGTRVAIIGQSGSGKSTLAKLLAGLNEPDAGRILVGGELVQPVEQTNRAEVGMLSQDTYIFAGTVAENIKYGRSTASDSEIIAAAKIAGLAEFIESLSEGYQTQLGQRGNRFSGGQRQRLALARVILQNPDVVVFDEPSAGLDPENARRFFGEVLSALNGKTILVVTHDLNNIEWADQIILIENGKVREEGSIGELTSKNSGFRRLRDGVLAAASPINV